ncbi:MAG: SpoIID/LytB domain-containing protein [Eubacteriales bacterium]|nr:SpoIID/LytB domain-containing protein [Eubacteriales bacterium]
MRKFLACLCALLLVPLAALGQTVTADATPAPYPAAPNERAQTIRVWLRRLDLTDRVDVTLAGQYRLKAGETTLTLPRGSEVAVLLKEGRLIAWCQGISLDAGAELTLERCAVESGENGLRFANRDALYEGTLRLTASDGVIRPVLSIDVEDYLLGVVAFEMGDDFPVEALKVQAIAARTYALYKAAASDGDYDVVDTTNDQVFKGRISGIPNVETAVSETRGVCGFYRNKLALCYYSASNGGQTELVENVWGASDIGGGYAMADDAYDLENPVSSVRSLVIPKKAAEAEQTPYRLRRLLSEALNAQLTARGWDTAPESLRVDEVTALSVDTPRFASPSRLMTLLHITFAYSGRTRTDAPAAAPVLGTPQPDEEVSLFATEAPSVSATPAPTVTAAPTAVPVPTATPAPVYGAFESAGESVTLEIPIFPTAKKILSLGLNGNDCEMVTVSESDDAFTLESRRFGHGVGLSQRGAEWMARRYGKTCDEIFAFYYPGMELKQYAGGDASPATVEPALLQTPGPAPTPTPRPTLMPVTEALPDGAWYARVTEIDDDSSLNLRAEPDTGSDVVRRLFKNQRLLVLRTCPEEGWVQVKTDAAEGYVMEKFLTKE